MAAENPVTIALKSTGTGEVTAALRGVRDAVVGMDKATVAEVEKGSRKRIASTKNEAKVRAKIVSDLNKQINSSTGATKALSPPTRAPASPAAQASSSALDTFKGSAAAGLLSKGIDLVTNALTQFGGFLVNDIVKPQFALEKFATQLQNSSAGAVKAQTVMDRSRAIQARWNIDAMEAAEAAATVADKTGDMKTAFDSVETNAMLSQGYGASMGELSELSAAIYNLDQNMGAGGLQKAMFTQLAQGQVAGGRFTIKDIAGLGGELVKKASLLGGDAQSQLASIGAALQTGGITGKADVSMTNLNSFISEAASKLKGVKENGKDIVKNGKVEDLGAAIRAVLMKTGGDAGKLKGMKYSDTGQSALLNYMGEFQAALKKGATAAEAAASATAVFEKMKSAVANEATVRAAANAVMMTAGERYNTAMNSIKDRLYGLMPQISAFTNSFVNKVPQIAGAAIALTKVFLALGSVLEKLIPEWDTRTKKSFDKEQKKQKIADESAKTTTEVEGIDKEIASLEANKRITPSVVFDTQMAYLQDQKAQKQTRLASLGEQYSTLEKPDVAETHAGVVDMLVKHGKSRDGDQGKSAEEIASFLERSGDVTLRGNPATEGLPTDVVDRLEAYRDEQRTRRESGDAAAEGAAPAAPVDAGALNEAAANIKSASADLKDAATASKDVPRTTPIGQR